ncbi:MAG TPA: PH domain-containing protein [Candidatus Limnocylindrales bacterium]|nr:PH domain-containing protein [Candidatus Limnocylindrales bacterium]
MSYTESLLASGERIVKIAHQHWFILVWRARWAILGLIIALLLTVLRVINPDATGLLWDILSWASLVLVVIGVLNMLWGALRYRAEEYVITTRRIVHAEGVINKRATDSSLEKINDAVLVESIFGRIFGFGDVDVLTASETGIDKLRMLRDAKDFKKAMLEAKHDLEIEITRPAMAPIRAAEPAPTPAPVAPPAPVATPEIDTADEVAGALARLGDLRDKGIISPEEFEAKKAELLGRL